MKKNILKIGIKLFLISVFIFFNLISAAKTNSLSELKNRILIQDTSFIEISGRVVDDKTNKHLAFVNIFLKGTNIATISNSDGDFILKIPVEKKNSEIEFIFIGYKNKSLSIKNFKNNSIINLVRISIPLSQIQIRPEYPSHPLELLKKALKKIPDNYSAKPNMLTGFYREIIKKNWYYVAVSEGVVNIYKLPYNHVSNDYIKLIKGRKSMDVKRMDTINFKIQGGPYSTLLMDVAKNPDLLFPSNSIDFYDFEFSNITKIDDKINYVIKFNQYPVDNEIYYKGKIYIDFETLAFSAIEFSVNPEISKKAANNLVIKKPLFMKISLEKGNYYVNYKENNGKWYLNYARGEVIFKCKWKRKLFKSKYTTISELAITDREIENVNKFSRKEVLSHRNMFIDKTTYFTKPDSFWGDYNYIKPNESIESAIKKLNKKFKKN